MKYEDDSMRLAITYRETGLTYAIIGKEFCVMGSTVRGWCSKYKERLGLDQCILDKFEEFKVLFNEGNEDIGNLSNILDVPHDFIKEWVEIIKYKRQCRGGVVASDNIKQEAIEMYKSGMTCTAIAEKISVSKSTVGNWINEVGISRYKKPERWFDPEIREKAVQMYLDGGKRVDICRELDIPKNILNNELTKRKISRTNPVKRHPIEIREKAKELYLSGLPSTEVADILGINQSSVSGWMRSYGVARSKSMNMKGENSHRYKPLKARKYDIGFTRELKERVISFFGYTCMDCGKFEKFNLARLHVHHVNNDQKDKSIPEDQKMFVTLCNECHSKTVVNKSYEDMRLNYLKIIDTCYGGKCMYTMEEYNEKFGYQSFEGDNKVVEEMKMFKKELISLYTKFHDVKYDFKHII